jgi:hypothetical protein
LVAISAALLGAGTFGELLKVLVPAIVSVPLTWTTASSFAFVASAEFTYCIDTGCPANPDPGVVRTVANVAGDAVGTIQNSVFTCPGPSWYTTV